MRVAITVVLACLLSGALGKAAQIGYHRPLLVEEVQQKGQTQVEEVQQAGQTQVEEVQQAGQTQVEEVQQVGQTQVEEVQQAGQTQVVTSEEERDYDDLSKDPDWVPSDDDYAAYEADKLEDDDEDGEEYFYDEEEDYDDDEWNEDDLEDENELWLSDEDPDWVPEEEVSEEQEEASDYEKLLLQIAKLVQTNANLHPGFAQFTQQDLSLDDILAYLRDVNMSESEARQVLNMLVLSGKEQQETNDISDESQEDQTQGYQTLPGHIKGGQGRLTVVTKRNVKSQYGLQQHGQWDQQQGNYGYRPGQVTTQNQQGQGDVDASQLSQGVEPLVPSYGHHREDLGDGVEPEQGSSHGTDEEDGPSLFDVLRHGWGFARDVAETVGDKAQEAASGVIDKVQDVAETAGERLGIVYESVRGDLRRFKESLLSAFARFGTVVQEGFGYCIDRLTHSYNQLQGMHVLEKLEKKLSEGNEHVIEFFNKIGQKVSKWKEQQVAENVDEGLVHGQQQSQTGYQTEGQSPNTEQVIPDFFQDDEILIELNKLVEVGELTHDDVQVITQQDQQQDHQQGQQNQEQHHGYY